MKIWLLSNDYGPWRRPIDMPEVPTAGMRIWLGADVHADGTSWMVRYVTYREREQAYVVKVEQDMDWCVTPKEGDEELLDPIGIFIALGWEPDQGPLPGGAE